MPQIIDCKKRAGFTMTETIIVLFVVGLVLGVIWIAADNVSEQRKINDAIAEMKVIAQNVVSLKQVQRTPFPATCSTAANVTSAMAGAGAIPRSYINVSNPLLLNSPFGRSTVSVWGCSRTVRVRFISPTLSRCVALMLAGISCQAGQAGCPTAVYTLNGSTSTMLVPDATRGWGVVGPAEATVQCDKNTPATSSVDFDYAF